MGLKKEHWLIIAILYSVLVLIVSLVKINPKVEVEVPFFDKWIHFGIYFVFTFIWGAYFVTKKVKKPVFYAMILALAFGVIIEVLQHLNPIARSGDVKDVLANSVGVLLAVLVFKKTKILKILKSGN